MRVRFAGVILRRLGQVLLAFILGVELIFVGYSLFKLAWGGPSLVFGWWWHLQADGSGGIGRPFSWELFLAQQITTISVAALLWWNERRLNGRSSATRRAKR
jgi:hypothetical protein